MSHPNVSARVGVCLVDVYNDRRECVVVVNNERIYVDLDARTIPILKQLAQALKMVLEGLE